ncbi:MAG: hypothetical protein ABSE68_01530 [Minisyncoccia bacterium]
MTKVQNFSENLEKSLARLGHEVSKKLESAENRRLGEKEVLKQSFQAMALNEEKAPTGGNAIPSAPAALPADDFMPAYLSGDANSKKAVGGLLQIAENGDIEKAVREARRYPPFIEDAFHDALVEKFLPEMKRRGIIK